MFPSKKRKDTRPYAEPERSASLQQRGNSPLQRRSPTSQLSVAKDAPVVNTASVTPAKAAQANTYLSSLASNCLVLGLRNWDVEAMVYSQTILPVNKYDKASGMKRILSATASAVEPSL